jgi:hypothetical protein
VIAGWSDAGNYVLGVDGDLEAGGGAWALTGGAAVVPGGDPP